MSCWTTPEVWGKGQGSISSVDIYGIISSSLFACGGRIFTDADVATSRVVLGLAWLLIFSAFLARKITVESIKTNIDYRIHRTTIRLMILNIMPYSLLVV